MPHHWRVCLGPIRSLGFRDLEHQVVRLAFSLSDHARRRRRPGFERLDCAAFADGRQEKRQKWTHPTDRARFPSLAPTDYN